jgi:hypothetical protein
MIGADQQVQARFLLSGCLPVRLRGPSLNAHTGMLAIEELGLAVGHLALASAGNGLGVSVGLSAGFGVGASAGFGLAAGASAGVQVSGGLGLSGQLGGTFSASAGAGIGGG